MKFQNYNSDEYLILKEIFSEIQNMDIHVVNIIEEYIYSNVNIYYNNNKLHKKYRTKFNEKDGLYESWYENGEKNERCTYKEGKLNGLYESWYENGIKCQLCNYREDNLEGTYKLWFNNGNLYEESTYVNNLKHGKYIWWWSNGLKKIECMYNKGIVLDETYKEWDCYGNVIN